jgi:hypothetical protein
MYDERTKLAGLGSTPLSSPPLKFVEPPRAHEMVRRYLHDCEYGGIAAIRQGMREAAKLKVSRIP